MSATSMRSTADGTVIVRAVDDGVHWVALERVYEYGAQNARGRVLEKTVRMKPRWLRIGDDPAENWGRMWQVLFDLVYDMVRSGARSTRIVLRDVDVLPERKRGGLEMLVYSIASELEIKNVGSGV